MFLAFKIKAITYYLKLTFCLFFDLKLIPVLVYRFEEFIE